MEIKPYLFSSGMLNYYFVLKMDSLCFTVAILLLCFPNQKPSIISHLFKHCVDALSSRKPGKSLKGIEFHNDNLITVK